MSLLTIRAGESADVVSPSELQKALLDQDARLRADLATVKSGDLFINAQTIGPGVNAYSTSGVPPQSTAAGYVWAIMNIGLELSASSQVRLYKQVPPTGAPIGGGRLVTTMQSFITPSSQFSKGQLMMRSGDILTVDAVTGTVNILSVFATYIEVAAEQIGKLLL